MKINSIFLAASLALLAVSCIHDDSTVGDRELSRISLSTPLSTTYTVNRWDTLKISPTIVQTGEQKSLSYEWEVNYNVVSKEPTFSYICSNFGTYVCRLRVTNGDEIQYYSFNLNVQYSYVRGIYILGTYQGKTIVSYLPDEVEGKSFSLDVLAPNNPDITFGAPHAIAAALPDNNNVIPYIYIATGNPSTIYEMDANLMRVLFTTPAEGNVSAILTNPNRYPRQELVFIDHSISTLTQNRNFLNNLSNRFADSLKHTVRMADALTSWKRNDQYYDHAFALFENERGHLLSRPLEFPDRPLEVLPGTFTGDTLIGMGAVDGERNLALITRNVASGAFNFYHIFPGYISRTVAKNRAAYLRYKGEMPATSGIQANSIVRTAKSKNVIYYSSGSNIYAYNVLSNGNFPTTPTFSVGSAGEVIVDMYINDDDSKIYIATNASSGDLPGSIYCYDLNEQTMLWQQKNITGKITKMIYRK